MGERRSLESVGFVGLGQLGGRMVRRLVDAGRPVVAWTRTPAEKSVPRGVELVATPAEVAIRSRVVIGCLLDDAAIERTYLDPDGLLSAVRPGTVLVEHGTFSPSLARELAKQSATVGAEFLDIPVTGGPDGADAGTLIGMAGGSAIVLDEVRPVLSAYTSRVHYVGGPGSGARLKLVNQMLVTVHMAAAAEAAALLMRTGIDGTAATVVLGGGWASSVMLERSLPRALASDFTASGATIGGLIHVQRLIREAFDDAGVVPRLLEPARAVFDAAVAAGLAQSDPAALVDVYREHSDGS